MAGKSKTSGLTHNQQIFVDQYVIDRNATRAYFKAYPNVKKTRTAEQAGSRLMRNVKVDAAIKEALAEQQERTKITADKVLKEMGRLAFSDVRKLFDEDGNFKSLQDLDDDTAKAVSSVEVATVGSGDSVEYVKKVRFWDKNKPLENLGKHFQLFVDRMKHGFDEKSLETILSALPDEYAEAVRRSLAEKTKGQ